LDLFLGAEAGLETAAVLVSQSSQQFKYEVDVIQ
jgi:hypothetical protein